MLRRLPETARLAHPAGEHAPWSVQDELLAQLLEEVSVVASQRQRKEPLRVPRPWDKHTPAVTDPRAVEDGTAGPVLRGNAAVAAKAAGMGRVRRAG
jgi:hypothetical protein